MDNWQVENKCVRVLKNYAGYIPKNLLHNYVNGITQTYVGCIGYSPWAYRTDFYANGAASYIPEMFEQFDDESAREFISVLKNNTVLKSRLSNNAKMNRLRTLGNIIYTRVSDNFSDKKFLEALINPEMVETNNMLKLF